MAKMSFEARMADLERLQGPPDAVLEEAASTLGIDLEKSIRLSFVAPLYKPAISSQGFREQWVLRWLLKKLGVSDSKSKGPAGASRRRCGIRSPKLDCTISNDYSSFTLNAKFWSLLLNLTCSIPDDVCAEILQERHFYE